MTGIELAVGYLFAGAVRRVRRAAGRAGERADREVDAVVDAGFDRLDALVDARLGGDTALKRLAKEAADGLDGPTARTRLRVESALADAADEDAGFARALGEAVERLRSVAPETGVTAGRDLSVRADHGSIAAVTLHGGAHVHHPQPPVPPQG